MDAKIFYDKELRKYNESETDLRSPDEFSIDCMVDYTKLMNGRLMPEPRVGQRLTQLDVLHTIISTPKWYHGTMRKQTAFYFKKSFLAGTISQKKIDRIFGRFGYKRIETIWVKK